MRRGTVLFVVGVLLVAAAVGFSYLFVVSGREAAPPESPRPPPPAAVLGARLLAASGQVELRSAADQPWSTAAAGAKLEAGTEVRTGEEGGAELAYGDDVRVRLASGSALRLGQLESGFTRLVLGKGLLFADVRGGRGARLAVTNERGEAVAEATDGALTVGADDAGMLRAAVTRGTATLSSHGETVTLRSGFYSVAPAGKKPAAPAAIPASLLLRVRWPEAGATAKRRQLVSGTATPGARVTVGGREAWADGKGRFRTIVDLSEGKNRIELRAVDLSGKEAHATSPDIELRTRAPALRVETSPDMWKKP